MRLVGFYEVVVGEVKRDRVSVVFDLLRVEGQDNLSPFVRYFIVHG